MPLDSATLCIQHYGNKCCQSQHTSPRAPLQGAVTAVVYPVITLGPTVSMVTDVVTNCIVGSYTRLKTDNSSGLFTTAGCTSLAAVIKHIRVHIAHSTDSSLLLGSHDQKTTILIVFAKLCQEFCYMLRKQYLPYHCMPSLTSHVSTQVKHYLKLL